MERQSETPAAAAAVNVSAKTAAKWVRRYRELGREGLGDRSSRPQRSPRRTGADSGGTGGGAAAGALDRPAHRADHRAEPWTGSRYSFSPSSTNQTGIEIVRPDFLPITLILIWR